MPSDPEAILDALAGGMSVPRAAKQFDVLEPEVRRILKEAVDRCYDGAHLRETWMLEDRRLAAVGLKFFHRAMEGDGDAQSAVVAHARLIDAQLASLLDRARRDAEDVPTQDLGSAAPRARYQTFHSSHAM